MTASPAAADDHGEQRVQRATFILRMWREPVNAGRAEWRGTVEHVQSGERRAVPDATGAAALVAGWLHELEESAGPKPS